MPADPFLAATCENLCCGARPPRVLHLRDPPSPDLVPFPPNRPSVSVRLVYTALYTHQYPTVRDNQWKAQKMVKGVRKNPHNCKSIRGGTFAVMCYPYRWPLRALSFQEALRVFFQPIKHDDARLDFYAIYKKEATEYDADYVKKYDEDLNTTLIFVRHLESVLGDHLTLLTGWSVLRRQFRLRHRCSLEA